MQIDGDSRGNSNNNDSKMDDNISDIVDNSKPNQTKLMRMQIESERHEPKHRDYINGFD